MAQRSELIIKGLTDDIAKYCRGFRMHKGKVRALSKKCLELSEEYQTIWETQGSLHETKVEAVLLKTIDCTRRWSKRCLCWQWISRHSMARDIEYLFNESCDTLQLLRDGSQAPPSLLLTIQTLSSPSLNPSGMQSPQSIPLPQTPAHQPIPLPSLSTSTTFPQFSPRASALPFVTQSFTPPSSSESITPPSPLALSVSSLPPMPDHSTGYPLLLASPSVRQPLHPSFAHCENFPSRDNRAPNHGSTVLMRGFGLHTQNSTVNRTSSAVEGSVRRSVTRACGNNRKPPTPCHFGPASPSQAHPAHACDFSAGSTSRNQRPKLRVKIPV